MAITGIAFAQSKKEFNPRDLAISVVAVTNNYQDKGQALTTVSVKNNSSQFTAFTQPTGRYSLPVIDLNQTYTIQPDNPTFTTAVTPTTQSAIFTTYDKIDSLNNFGLQRNSVKNLAVQITSQTSRIRQNRPASFNLTATNLGTETMNPTILFRYDPRLPFKNSNPTPSSQYPGVLVWNLADFLPCRILGDPMQAIFDEINEGKSVNWEINIYPNKAKVIFRVGLSNYEHVSSEAFRVVADFAGVDMNRSKYVPVRIELAPSFIKNLDYSPKSVEYIVYR